MLANLFTKIFGSRNKRLIKQMYKAVDQVNALEPAISELTDDELRHKTEEFRTRLSEGATLDELLFEAFAVVREAGRRTINLRHFDEQLIGGMVLHQGKIAEMRTGEGKTLVATLSAYLNALSGKGVHIVTVNDYLAKRDAEWMGPIYELLDMRVGVNLSTMSPEEKRAAYSADITYGTNNEFGFDYLRDNMAFRVEERVQRGLNFAVVDEVDSILIDEARTPLIISGATEDHSLLYKHINKIIPSLTRQAEDPDAHKDEEIEIPGDYYVDEKNRQVILSEEGHQHIEELLRGEGILNAGENLYDAKNISLMHHVQAALRAHALFQRNVDYIVSNNQIVIIDEFTGRQMPGRRWSEGLHQAIEAKEDVRIQNENQTLASITFQNLFRLYSKLSGMTGTADTEAYEFQQIYGLEVVVIPTHKPMIREDFGDSVYLTAREKYNAILADIQSCRQRGQPALVGTASIENSETLSKLLKKADISDHQVLNAKFHEQEAEIIAQAGRPGKVTIATNMAGRGTDIVLGGNVEADVQKFLREEQKKPQPLSEEELQQHIEKMRAEWQHRHDTVIENGGLHIIGTERHESRRIDNQLRGRSGRQGDPGSSRFYLSLEDNLMRIFASERVAGLMQKIGMEEGEAIEHPWVTKAIENAQRKVEGRNFDIRKQLLEYDNVANDQRKVVYEQRNELMESASIVETIKAIREDVLTELIDNHIPPQSVEELWAIPELEMAIQDTFGVALPIAQWLKQDNQLFEEPLRQKISGALTAFYAEKEQHHGAEAMRYFEKALMLQILDENWKEHLAAMDYLRQGIHLRGFAQKNPKQEFKREAFEMFTRMLEQIKQQVISKLYKLHIVQENLEETLERQQQRRRHTPVQYKHPTASALVNDSENASVPEEATPPKPKVPFVRPERKTGRNEPCPCGSGKKYKNCHGKLQ
ncbi:MAG: preprotein translocase subunit SecA [Beggiatoa sp. IS2]|nr:MAG: preprotein translocase subunit SecA [Beggiatoa sp. IS2]